MPWVAQPSFLRYSLSITFCTSLCCIAFSPQLAPPSLPFFPLPFIFLLSFCSSSPIVSSFFFLFFFLLLLFIFQWVGPVSNSYLGHYRQVLFRWSPFSIPKLSQSFLSFRARVWANAVPPSLVLKCDSLRYHLLNTDVQFNDLGKQNKAKQKPEDSWYLNNMAT